MKLFGIALSSLALVACGGGGNDSVQDTSTQFGPPVALSTANYVEVSKEVLGGVSSLQNTGNLSSDFFTGAEVSGTVTVTSFIKDKLPAVLQKFGKQTSQFTGVTQSEVINCSTSGRMDLSYTDVNGNEQADRGDSVTMTAFNCNENGSVVNGSLNLRFESVSGNPDYPPFGAELSVTANGLRIENAGESVVGNGSLAMSFDVQSSTRLSIGINTANFVSTSTVNGVTKTYQQTNFVINLNQNGASTTMTLSGAMNVPSLGGNTVNVQTITPIVMTNNGYPTAGQLMLSTNLGGKIRMSANSTPNAMIELDANSDGTFESSSTLAWNALF